MRYLILASTLILAACVPEANIQMREQRTGEMQISDNTRFSVTRVGVFTDDLAYNNRRGIYVITDRKTGAEYLGVSGIGVSELGSHLVGKIHSEDER
jgi:hypothetical protein